MAAGESPTSAADMASRDCYCYWIWTARMARCTLADPVRQCTTVVLVLFCTGSICGGDGVWFQPAAECKGRE